jgi:hypothetical protein
MEFERQEVWIHKVLNFTEAETNKRFKPLQKVCGAAAAYR